MGHRLGRRERRQAGRPHPGLDPLTMDALSSLLRVVRLQGAFFYGVEATQPLVFSADETTDIGYESGTTVTADYDAHTSRFTGRINWVQIDTGDDDHDHLIDPEERLRVAMARQ